MADKYFNSVEVTIRDWNGSGQTEYLSDDSIIRLGDALKGIRRAELRLERTVRDLSNPYG